VRILLVHQNFPGQFLHLAPELVARGHEVMALTASGNERQTRLKTMRYAFTPPEAGFDSHGLAATYFQMTERGRAAARAAVALRDTHGFSPDVILGNLGWGETLFLKEVWPEARLLIYAEFFYNPRGYDVGFDPEFSPGDIGQRLRVVARQAHLLQAMTPADAAVAPTRFQAESFPAFLRDRIDAGRVHFIGRVPYDRFVSLMQVSRVHAYLTYPFVLSWSLLEAMACGAHVTASRTPPVEEVLTHGKTGRLVDFFDVAGWEEALISGLAEPDRFSPLRDAGRAHVAARYDLRRQCLPRMVDFVETGGT